MIRVVLPAHLRILARIDGEVKLDVEGQATQRSVLDALEARYPMLLGTIRDQVTQKRRPFVRFFACEQDLSHEPPDAPLPDAVVTAAEPFLVVGAMAGGSKSRPSKDDSRIPSARRYARNNHAASVITGQHVGTGPLIFEAKRRKLK